MEDIPLSPTLLVGSSVGAGGKAAGLDLSSIPPIGVLSAHFKANEDVELKESLRRHSAPLTADVSKVKVFIGKVGTKRRAEFELRARKFRVEEVAPPKRLSSPVGLTEPPKKRRRLSGTSIIPVLITDEGSTTEEETPTQSETEEESAGSRQGTPVTSPIEPEDSILETPSVFENSTNADIVWVVRLDWLESCISAGHLLPLGDALVYKGRVVERPPSTEPKCQSIKDVFSALPKSATYTATQSTLTARPQSREDILERAKSDVLVQPKRTYQRQHNDRHGSRRFEGKSFAPNLQRASNFASQTAHLLQQTTSDYEGEDSDLPPPPDWVKKGIKYACQRYTPANGPNVDFIEQLKKIRTARTLIDDEIGVRAYSTIIAAIAAYPYRLGHPREIAQLPGCDEKTAVLFVEWKNTGKIQAVEDYENDEAMKVLRQFYDIWGVGAKTARHFYYNNHWTELDDIIEFGWKDLDRVQQIGLKYYDEFLDPIPRSEVEQIAETVRQHAVRLRDERITITIVGGYRRGKKACGDVDMIVSHPDLAATAGLVKDIVESLEDAEWITHTLTLSLNNTNRGQNTLQFRTSKAPGTGYDTLDKALVVWQDPRWPTREQDLAKDPKAKNPNIHRRVDIIISPWRTVGCAVAGWTSGTTFQRDLRRYCKHVKGWKFDSSGVRSRSTGEVVQLEGPNGIDGTPEEAERSVFEGLGLEFIPPEYRCTN